MPMFVIERDMPGLGSLPRSELQAASRKSNGVLEELGPRIQWIQSFVTDDKMYCLYISPDEETVQQHAAQGGFPANSIARVHSVIDPTTGE